MNPETTEETPKVEPEAKEELKKEKPISKNESEGEANGGDTFANFASAAKGQTQAEADAEEAKKEITEVEEVFELNAEPKIWIIGKPPEQGGKDDDYSQYVQKPLGVMPRMQWFGILTNTISESVKAGGAVDLGMSDVFGEGGGSIRERFQTLTNQDFSDAGSFIALAFKIAAYAPDFLMDSFVIWLDVPPAERTWAKRVMKQSYDPEREQWGLKEDQFLEIIEIFIDQNYADIRDFFVKKLPRVVARVQQREREKTQESSSAS